MSKWKHYNSNSLKKDKNIPPLNLILKMKWGRHHKKGVYVGIVTGFDYEGYAIFEGSPAGDGIVGSISFFWDYISDNEMMAYL